MHISAFSGESGPYRRYFCLRKLFGMQIQPEYPRSYLLNITIPAKARRLPLAKTGGIWYNACGCVFVNATKNCAEVSVIPS